MLPNLEKKESTILDEENINSPRKQNIRGYTGCEI